MMIDFLQGTWPWYVAGPLISIVLLLLLYWGKSFGVSANYRTLCSMAGLGKCAKFFDFDWKTQKWNLVFIIGTLVGAAISHMLIPNGAVEVSDATVRDLADLGISTDGQLVPLELFGTENLFSLRSLVVIVLGGLLIGFGTRYAGGCTSGHAISGLSDLQLPSLIAVAGFFIGGLMMTHLLLPYILDL